MVPPKVSDGKIDVQILKKKSGNEQQGSIVLVLLAGWHRTAPFHLYMDAVLCTVKRGVTPRFSVKLLLSNRYEEVK
jgi:hypothetical protein